MTAGVHRIPLWKPGLAPLSISWRTAYAVPGCETPTRLGDARARQRARGESGQVACSWENVVQRNLARDLRKERSSRRSQAPLAQPDDKRRTYSVRVVLTSPEHRRLYRRARADRRKMSSYVTKVALERLHAY
jgi:hypothetical protein